MKGDINVVRQEIREFLGFNIPDAPVPFKTHEIVAEQAYLRALISYTGREGDRIPAYLLLPQGSGPFAAVLVHHQHHGERHIGKSEVCGLVGDPLQAFGPVLVRRGVAVLAPDSICFEDRRRNRIGTEPDGDADGKQHFDEMAYRLLQGDTLMRKVLDDSARGISLLREHPLIDAGRIGILGHSYGGNTVLFHAALDSRIHYLCASGAACSYQYKLSHQIGIEMAAIIPGFATRFDIPDLVRCMAPRRVLLMSATEDKYSQDADSIAESAREAWVAQGVEGWLEHVRYAGGHELTQERFDTIVEWLIARASA